MPRGGPRAPSALCRSRERCARRVVSLVAHYDVLLLPPCPIESGRAGRDGVDSHAVLLWSGADFTKSAFYADGQSAERAQETVRLMNKVPGASHD